MLNPIISPVPEKFITVRGKEKSRALSDYARWALKKSALLSSFSPIETKKDTAGVPLPDNGIYWSISHKPLYVAAVCSHIPIGVDIEQINPRSPLLFNKIASEDEWQILGNKSWDSFYRLFTAKESVLKATGVGLKGLQKCTIKQVADKNNLILEFLDKEWEVSHHRIDDHIASVTSAGLTVNWGVLPTDGASSERSL